MMSSAVGSMALRLNVFADLFSLRKKLARSFLLRNSRFLVVSKGSGSSPV